MQHHPACVISSLCSPPPTYSPCPTVCFLPSFTKLLFYFCFPCPSPSLLPPPLPPSTLPLFTVLSPGALFICFRPSGCLPWPPVLCFNGEPMGTGVHSKTGRACEQEAGSGAGGDQPAVTSALPLPHLDRSIPRALPLPPSFFHLDISLIQQT